MARAIPSGATASILAWVRESAGYSIEQVSKLDKFDSEKLLDWERGKGSPTISQLRRLARRYKHR